MLLIVVMVVKRNICGYFSCFVMVLVSGLVMFSVKLRNIEYVVSVVL